jgi:hypothetical protein
MSDIRRNKELVLTFAGISRKMDDFTDAAVNGRIKLKFIFEKEDVKLWMAFK